MNAAVTEAGRAAAALAEQLGEWQVDGQLELEVLERVEEGRFEQLRFDSPG